MSTFIKFPNDRLEYPGLLEPLFTSDIRNATENINDLIRAVLGYKYPADEEFWILSGFEYVGGAYNGGIVFMGDHLYLCEGGLIENQYLLATQNSVYNKSFGDLSVHATYVEYLAVANNGSGTSPKFTGNMNSYRVSLSLLKDAVNTLNTQIDNLAGYIDAHDIALATKANSSDVFTKTQLGNTLKKVIDIGDWNMDTTSSVSFTFATLGLSFIKVNSVTVFIREDIQDALSHPNDIAVYPIEKGGSWDYSRVDATPTGIILTRTGSGYFDTTFFSNTSYNRGFIKIEYTL